MQSGLHVRHLAHRLSCSLLGYINQKALFSSISVLIKDDHASLNDVYQSYVSAEGNIQEQQRWRDKLQCELKRHNEAKELILYPAFVTYLGVDGKRMADESRNKHEEMNNLMHVLETSPMAAEHRRAVFEKLMATVRDQINKEQEKHLPNLDKVISSDQGASLAQKFCAKRFQCTHTEFVEVLNEPCHRPIIRNSRANIFVAKVARNHTTMYHRHKENTIYTVVSGSLCSTQLLGASPLSQEYVTGDCFLAEHRLKPIIHRVRCLEDSPTDAWFVGTEILQSNASVSYSGFQHANYRPIPQINVTGCRAYRFQLSPNETTGRHSINYSGLFISLTTGELQIDGRDLNPGFPVSSGAVERGYVTWFDGSVSLEIRNLDSHSYEALILEIP